jgi:hypothetical protein
MQGPVLRSSSANGCYAHACLSEQEWLIASYTVDSISYGSPRCPPLCNGKPDTTEGDFNDGVHPGQMPRLRTTHEFPESVRIDRNKAICGYDHEPTRRSRPRGIDLAVTSRPIRSRSEYRGAR